MKIDIIVVYVQRYKYGHEKDFVPPITGIHLASITPPQHSVRVIHQQVEPVNFETDADLIAISFFSGFANEAYRLGKEFRKRNKLTVAGGPHVTFCKEESLMFFDAIVLGEAESVWAEMLNDFESGVFQRIYEGTACDLQNIPTPRYDLLSSNYFVKRVVQATRGCPYSCSFCTVPKLNPGFRMRPIEDVLADIKFNNLKYWWERKIVWFWDDNLTINRKYIKELLNEMIPLNKWWLTQASIDVVKDEELLLLMKQSGCIGVFLGLESFGVNAIADAQKSQNRIEEYKLGIAKLHEYGIAVMAGLISGFDSDTPKSIESMANDLMDIGVDVPFLSIMTPFVGTEVFDKLESENRLLLDRGWEFFNGYNVTFMPVGMSPEQLLKSHRKLWKSAFSFFNVGIRIVRSLRYLRAGGFLLCLFMNSFYGYKQLRRNLPRDMAIT